MNDRSLKKSFTGKNNGPVDENTDLFSVNRGTSLDVLLKPRRHSFEQAKVLKPEPDDEKKHVNDPLPEVTLGTLSRLVLEARNVTLKPQSISTTKTGSRNENDRSSRPTRSGSTTRPSNIPSLRSSSVPKKTTTASASTSVSVNSPKRIVSRSLTPSTRKTPSPSSTPSRITTTTSTTPSFKKSGDVPQRSRSLTPRSKTQIAANLAPRTNVRSASVSAHGSVHRDGCTSASETPKTPPRLKEKVTLAFGRPVGTTGNVNSPKRNTSPDVTRTRPKGNSPSLIPTFSGVSKTAATPKSVKPSATVADSTRSGRKLSKASVQMAINHLDVARNGKVSTKPFSSTKLYPHSIRSSSSIRKRCDSSEGSSSSNQEEEEGRSLTKEGDTENKKDSARYEALLSVKDVKDTNWLLNVDDESHPSLIFDNAFDSPPDLFPPL
ncbi:hypothetical protein V5N11_013033 [Cardamine amara subsp. amara]|uniref:Uncharacterized protein n=1 Tax=Cardamine amara subsp. amara TaxID=228776 RepID=A0ABD0ZYQ9_CARAN